MTNAWVTMLVLSMIANAPRDLLILGTTGAGCILYKIRKAHIVRNQKDLVA